LSQLTSKDVTFTRGKMKLTKQDSELIQKAKETADKLHVDDVHEVAAAIRTKGGKIFSGIHIDASVGFADVCGEVAALCTAISNGYREFDSIVAVWGDGKGNYKLLSPCGRCRELISDFGMDIWVIVGTLEKPYKLRVSELLPLKNK